MMQDSDKPLVFISCGQSTEAERTLGKQIAGLVEELTDCHAYFAENQRSLEGVTNHILRKLQSAVAFIAVVHPRGDVTNPHSGRKWVRGSVWVEQEIAIAAFMLQVLGSPLEVIAYIHKSIEREGLRDKVLLNPIAFESDSEILTDLKTFLPEWKVSLSGKPRSGLSLKPAMVCREVPVPGGSLSGNERCFLLDVFLENDGTEEATEFRLDLEFPGDFDDAGSHVLRRNPQKPGYQLFRVDHNHQGYAHIYPTEKTGVLLEIRLVVRATALRTNPTLSKQPFTATVYSKNMKPRTISRSITELIGNQAD